MFAPSIEVKAVYERLQAAPVNEVVSYSELRDLINRNPQIGRGYSIVKTAREKALREKQMVFEIVPNIGLKHLCAPDIVDTSSAPRDRIRRIARKAFAKLTSINGNFASLTREQQLRHNLNVSVYGAVAHITHGTQVRRLEASIKDTALPVQKTLDAFRDEKI